MARTQRRSARGIRTIVRLLSVLVLALWFGQAATYAVAWVATDGSAQHCPDDDDDGCHCPLDCGCCARCAHSAPAIPPSALTFKLLLPPLVEEMFPDVKPPPPSSEPREIQHVPRRARG